MVLALSIAGVAVPTASAQRHPIEWNELESTALAELRATRTPGAAVAVVMGDSVVFAKGFGTASVETGLPVTADMLFRIGSTTKMLTAAALAVLRSQQKLRFDTPISRYGSGLDPQIGNLTVHALLSHTAGVRDGASFYGPHDDAALPAFVRSWTAVDYLFTIPGEVYSYSNPGYALAGWVLAEVAGKPYADAMRELLFEPLGMSRTTLRPTVAMTYPFAQGHDVVDTAAIVVRPFADDARYWPNGSVFTSANEFARFAVAFLNGGRLSGRQVLVPSVIADISETRATIPGGSVDDPARAAYGLVAREHRGVKMLQHGGSRLGFGSVVRMAPQHRFAVIILTNRTGAFLPNTLEKATELALPLEPRVPGVPPRPMSMPISEMATYAGRYVNQPGELDLELFVRNDTLLMRRPGATQASTVTKIGQGRFTASGQELSILAGPDNTPKYLHIAGRALRRVRRNLNVSGMIDSSKRVPDGRQ
jgi:CubicO group peptidase (beta-lactamase class C family)